MLFIYRAIWYLKYKLTAQSNQYLHSPFLFELYNSVFNDIKLNSQFYEIENLRNKFLNNNNIIEVIDLGAGSIVYKKLKCRKISSIAATALQKPKYARFLYRLVEYSKSKSILELGTSLGITTRYLSSGAGLNGHVITIEGSPEIASLAKSHFDNCNSKRIELYEGDFMEILKSEDFEEKKFDFVFIDGNHQKDAVLQYFDLICSKLNEGSVVVVDDIHWSKDMVSCWEELKNRNEVTLSFDVFQFGVLFINKNLSKQNFRLRY